MATTQLQTVFSSLPEPIQDWLSSEKLVEIISSLNKELGLKGESQRLLPRLILRLAAQDIDTRDFINSIGSELKINYEAAKGVAQKLYDQALKPIEEPLRQIGINADAVIKYPAPPLTSLSSFSSAASPAEAEKKTAKLPPTKETARPAGTIMPKEAAKPPDNLPIPEETKEGRPFVLHEENDSLAPLGEGASEVKPSFAFKQPLNEKKGEEPAVRAEVESWEKKPIMRVVHYSNFYTPFNHSTVNVKTASAGGQKIKIPDSRWFI